MVPLSGSSVVLAVALAAGAPAHEGPANRQAAAPAPPQSRELTPSVAQTIPPFPPENVTVDVIKGAMTLTWDKSPLTGVVLYRIYRKGAEKYVRIAETSDTTFVDKAAKRGTIYSVTAVNVYGAESSQAPANPPKKH